MFPSFKNKKRWLPPRALDILIVKNWSPSAVLASRFGLGFWNIILKGLNLLFLKIVSRTYKNEFTSPLLSFDGFCDRYYRDLSLILPTTGRRPYLGAAKFWALLSWVKWGPIGSSKSISSSLHIYWWRPLMLLVSNGLHSFVSVVHLPSHTL